MIINKLVLVGEKEKILYDLYNKSMKNVVF